MNDDRQVNFLILTNRLYDTMVDVNIFLTESEAAKVKPLSWKGSFQTQLV